MSTAIDWICRQDARHRLVIAGLVAVAVFVSLRGRVSLSTELLATWNAFGFCVLLLAWLTIVTTPPAKLRQRAKEQDVSRLLIFIFVVAAACTSLFSIIWLLRANKAGAHQQLYLSGHVALTILAIACAWLLLHTVFGLRYAHTFYGDDDENAEHRHGGLDFPGERFPNYVDFAYFSFVIGMTFQVSDVQITSRQIRGLVLLHGLLSFVFNTVILALAITTISAFI
ncbi:MAG: DUF1345 domain-containing protein [Chthoniobacterales bacterium]